VKSCKRPRIIPHAAAGQRGTSMASSPPIMIHRLKEAARRGFRRMKNSALFFEPGHFYSPIPSREDAERAVSVAATRMADRPIGLNLNTEAMIALWHQIAPEMADIPFGDHKDANGFRYHFLNEMYSYGDAAVYYGMIKHFKPKRIIEIGSGYTSALALDAREILKREIELTFIEPYTDRLDGLLRGSDRQTSTIIKKKVQEVDLDVFKVLEANDILFIDSSHVAKVGSDVCFEIFEILPILRPGVIIHFHDCFWPFEYPREWAVDQNRAWNELYFLRAFLAFNNAFEILYFNGYFYFAAPRFDRRVRHADTQEPGWRSLAA
jgi:hypothetical protein